MLLRGDSCMVPHERKAEEAKDPRAVQAVAGTEEAESNKSYVDGLIKFSLDN